MAGRVVVFGATGYTGTLTAQALVERSLAPVIAGRSAEKLGALARRLGGLDVAVADGSRPGALGDLLESGDVMIAAAGPFVRVGEPAVEAAVTAGCSYLDCTGEPSFVRRVFEHHGPRAQETGAALVTAFGYDYVPGNLAAALALREAGGRATRVDVGYYLTGALRPAAAPASLASLAAAIMDPAYSWRGALVTERGGARMRRFDVDGRRRPALSIGASEHLALPREHPELREVNVYLGWFGPLTRALQLGSPFTPMLARRPRAKAAFAALTERALRVLARDPAVAAARLRSHVVAAAYDAGGTQLAEVHVGGAGPQELTARLLAWGAERALSGGLGGTGALGPVEAFGVDELEAGCAEAGLTRLATRDRSHA